ERQRFIEGRPWLDGQPAHEKLGADIVGEVGDDLDRESAIRKLDEVGLQRIAGYDLEPAGITVGDLRKGGEATFVALDGDDALGTFGQHGPRQSSGTGAHLDDDHAFQTSGTSRDLAG